MPLLLASKGTEIALPGSLLHACLPLSRPLPLAGARLAASNVALVNVATDKAADAAIVNAAVGRFARRSPLSPPYGG